MEHTTDVGEEQAEDYIHENDAPLMVHGLRALGYSVSKQQVANRHIDWVAERAADWYRSSLTQPRTQSHWGEQTKKERQARGRVVTAVSAYFESEREVPLTAFIKSGVAPGVVDVLRRNGYSLTVDQVGGKRVLDVASMVEPDNEVASTLPAFHLADYMRRHGKLRGCPDADEPE